MAAHPDDAERLDALLPALRTLERDAFTDLYDLMAPHLLTFTNGLIGDRVTAEDVVQDVFVRFTQHARRFRGDGKGLLAWLYTTARRRCIDHLRRHSTHRETTVDTLPERAAAPTDEGPDPTVRAAMDRLTEGQRTAIVLRRVLGYSGEEVGELLELDRDAVYALCARGEAALRRHLSHPSDPERPERPEPR